MVSLVVRAKSNLLSQQQYLSIEGVDFITSAINSSSQ